MQHFLFKRIFRALSIFFLFVSTGCALHQPPYKLTAVSYAALPGWDVDEHKNALKAFLRSCDILMRKPAHTALHPSGTGGKLAAWQNACTEAYLVNSTDNRAAQAFFEQTFSPYRIEDVQPTNQGLFTGYYEIDLRGSRTPSPRYSIPLYRLPPDKQKNQPYYTRAEIHNGVLKGRGLELLYLDDPVKAFFLHIQGSGRVLLEDGTSVRVQYAGQNGHSYVAVGKILIERNILSKETVSAQSIQAWMYAHPEEAKTLMEHNPSYVFFRENSNEGPIGAQGAVLTEERSLAVDKRYIPYGVPLWLDTTYPANNDDAIHPYQRLMVAQDTGGAIKGVIRGDIFFGYGNTAAYYAGLMKQRGTYYLLLPHTEDDPYSLSSLEQSP